MAKAASKIALDQCPRCKTRDPEARFCPECGARMGHTGRPGRPPADEKRFRLFTTVSESLGKQVIASCKKDENLAVFLRAAVNRELKARTKRDGKRTAKK